MNLKELLNPFPEKRTKVYGVISEIEKHNEKLIMIHFDLVNDQMIRFDNEEIYSIDRMKDSNPKEKLYLYFMTIETDYDIFNRYFSNQKNDEVYEYELIPTNSYNKNIDNNALKCDVYFTASPISKNSYYIKLIRKSFPIPISIPHLKNEPLNDLTAIEEELNSIFSYSMEANYFRVHNVGQGSCNTVIFNGDNKIFYDIGITKFKNKDSSYKRYEKTFSHFKLQDYHSVILSHWDEDHYIGLVLDDEGVLLQKKWVVPDIGISPNISRIAYIIDNYGKLVRISNDIKGKFYDKDEFVLFKGSGPDKNNSGIILGINGFKHKLVAMGDVAYKYASFVTSYSDKKGKVFESIDYLIVPHHGADVEGNIIFNPKVPITKSENDKHPSEAIISVGYNPKGTYNHPRNNTIVELHSKEFRIIRTDKDGRRIIKF